jgi:glucokinase
VKFGSAERQVLAADVGGTKTLLALAPLSQGAAPSALRAFASRDAPDLETLLERFLASAGRPELAAAAIAGAGPVEDDAIALTHLPWRIEAERVARALGTTRVCLLNDLAATALGMLDLPPGAWQTLQPGRARRDGTIAVIAAGTGLGEALIVFDGGAPRALPSEGGHAAFAPRGPREIALLAQLAGPGSAHVPVEDVVSGPGLVRIHDFLRARTGGGAPGAAASPGDRAAAIAAAALHGDDPLCVEALELFARCYGAAAGDLALHGFATGGVRLGGGIAPKILPALRRGGFLEAFRDKGRFRDWLAALPVAVCTAEDAALRGALREARRIAASR